MYAKAAEGVKQLLADPQFDDIRAYYDKMYEIYKGAEDDEDETFEG